MSTPAAARLRWTQVVRLGLVQAALGAIVVLTTSTLNRIMVVELTLPAIVPGLLVGLHYAVQLARPRLGHGSDVGGRCTPWIVGGMAVLALGGALAALATVWIASRPSAGIGLAVAAFGLIGLGVGASGTSLLVLMAKRVDPAHRAAAAATVWLMMIAGFVVTATVAGTLLDPYSPARLLAVCGSVCLLAFATAAIAVTGIEGPRGSAAPSTDAAAPSQFRDALAAAWADPTARRFTIFVFISMLAYSAQDLILEPFAGLVLGFTPGESTRLSGVQHGGVLAGMLLAGAVGSRCRGRGIGSLRGWTVGGCLASALAMAGLVAAGSVGADWPFKQTVFALGVANGAFSIAAIGTMMQLAGEGLPHNEGVRMGLWGAAQAIAFALGGLLGTGASDLARRWLEQPGPAYGCVFALEAVLFVVSAVIASRVSIATATPPGHRADAWAASHAG